MKYIILFLLIPALLSAQKSFERSKIEVLESYEASYQNFWTSEKQSIKISLVQHSDSTSRTSTVNFEVFSKDYVKIGNASSVAVSSAFDFAFGNTSIEKIDRKQGLIKLNKTEFLRLVDFLNETITKKVVEKPQFETAWQLTIDHRFMVALIYRPLNTVNWFYCLSIDNAAFEISTDETLLLMQKLSAIKKRLSEN